MKYFFVFILLFSKVTLLSKSFDSSDLLLIEINYKSKFQTVQSFCIIDRLNLESINKDSINHINPPNMLYILTKYGGYYVSDYCNSLFTWSCYQYGNIESYLAHLGDTTLLNTYYQGKLLDKLDGKLSVKVKIVKPHEKYVIKIWSIKLDYRICNLFMETPMQRPYSYKTMYIKSISKIEKAPKSIKKIIRKNFKNI